MACSIYLASGGAGGLCRQPYDDAGNQSRHSEPEQHRLVGGLAGQRSNGGLADGDDTLDSFDDALEPVERVIQILRNS